MDTQSLRSEIGNWTLGSDEKLLSTLQNFSTNLFDRLNSIESELDDFGFAVSNADLKLQNTINKFLMLSNTQFVENRIYEDEPILSALEPVDENSEMVDEELSGTQLISKYTSALNFGMEALESHPKVPVSRKSLRRSGLKDKLNFEDELVVPLFKKPKKDRPDSSSPAQSSKDQQKSPKKSLNLPSGLFASDSDEDFFGESMPSHRKKPGKSLFDGEEEEDLPMQPETVEPSLPTEMIGDLFADDVEEDLFALLGKADTEKETPSIPETPKKVKESEKKPAEISVEAKKTKVQRKKPKGLFDSDSDDLDDATGLFMKSPKSAMKETAEKKDRPTGISSLALFGDDDIGDLAGGLFGDSAEKSKSKPTIDRPSSSVSEHVDIDPTKLNPEAIRENSQRTKTEFKSRDSIGLVDDEDNVTGSPLSTASPKKQVPAKSIGDIIVKDRKRPTKSSLFGDSDDEDESSLFVGKSTTTPGPAQLVPKPESTPKKDKTESSQPTKPSYADILKSGKSPTISKPKPVSSSLFGSSDDEDSSGLFGPKKASNAPKTSKMLFDDDNLEDPLALFGSKTKSKVTPSRDVTQVEPTEISAVKSAQIPSPLDVTESAIQEPSAADTTGPLTVGETKDTSDIFESPKGKGVEPEKPYDAESDSMRASKDSDIFRKSSSIDGAESLFGDVSDAKRLGVDSAAPKSEVAQQHPRKKKSVKIGMSSGLFGDKNNSDLFAPSPFGSPEKRRSVDSGAILETSSTMTADFGEFKISSESNEIAEKIVTDIVSSASESSKSEAADALALFDDDESIESEFVDKDSKAGATVEMEVPTSSELTPLSPHREKPTDVAKTPQKSLTKTITHSESPLHFDVPAKQDLPESTDMPSKNSSSIENAPSLKDTSQQLLESGIIQPKDTHIESKISSLQENVVSSNIFMEPDGLKPALMVLADKTPKTDLPSDTSTTGLTRETAPKVGLFGEDSTIMSGLMGEDTSMSGLFGDVITPATSKPSSSPSSSVNSGRLERLFSGSVDLGLPEDLPV
eukprot:28650_1